MYSLATERARAGVGRVDNAVGFTVSGVALGDCCSACLTRMSMNYDTMCDVLHERLFMSCLMLRLGLGLGLGSGIGLGLRFVLRMTGVSS